MRKSTHKVALISIISLIIIVLCGCDQSSPTIVNGEFPIHFTYELNGNIYDIEDTVICEFSGFDVSGGFGKMRTWDEYLKSGTNRISILTAKNVHSVLDSARVDTEIEIFLDYGQGDYYMDDPNASSLTHGKPHVCYVETYDASPKERHHYATALTDKQLQEYFGIKIINFTFSPPIDNTFK
ncbi:MAG TPA: hypothetical protein DHW61_03200 [Lachnoclostridium phytofermentans]|uniref:Uncharacterized protein n=1 Tax=Lachnoclostridium phytofermentans TaxID=66219 RepID=A0A3D2X2S9_9FIRM|nr:hypothetical protein [Lachnoclostridium sp.]HCL01412.1 hypothetical protein [Lachnoclostridium phytofermentans]